MRTKFLFFLIFSSLFVSGCLREYSEIYITNMDVMTSQQDDGVKLTITPYIQNNQNTDSGILYIKAKIKDPSTNLIVSEKDLDIGYIKSKSSAYNSVSLSVSDPGNYYVEVQLFEGNKLIAQSGAQVIVKARPGPEQPAEIKLTDMSLIITKFVDGASNAFVEISPGIYNQGGDSKPLTMEVVARVDPYTAHTQKDELGIVKGSDRVRGKVSFVIPRNREYSFTVRVIENGKTAVRGKVEKVKLNEIKFNAPMIFILIAEGKPPTPTPKEPGFEVVVALIGMLLVYAVRRIKNKGDKNGR